MPNESQIDRIEQQLDDIARLGGKAERTAIFTNVTVVDANPAGLTNRVIIQDPRDGDYVPALKVPGIVYNNNDLVNVLFLEGTEPLAFQQGSGSSTATGLWQLEGGTGPDIYYDQGNVGIGTSTPNVPLDIDTASNTAGIRLRGLAETVEIADFYVTSNGALVIDLTANSDSAPALDIRTKDNAFGVLIRESDGTGTVYANLYMVDDTVDYLNILINDSAASAKGLLIDDNNNASANTFGTIVKNTSGATANSGDVGYLDENNEYKTTTTAEFETPNPVAVLLGGANNTDIYVTQGPGRATLNYAGSAPSSGDILTFSTTAGKVQARSTMHPAILAQARANGSGGAVEVELLLRRTPFLLSSSNETFFVNNADDSDFVAVVSAAGVSGDKVYHDPPSSGNQNCVTPFATTDLMKIVLHNTTRGEEAFIIAAGTDGTDDFIQVSNSADIAAWSSGDTITSRSQTNTSTIGTSRWFDLEITSSEIPELAIGAVITVSIRDTGAVGEQLFIHPFEADVTAKRQKTLSVNTAQFNDADKIVPLIQRRVCVLWTASGSGTARVDYRVREVIVAA